jgi:hypothetical protein
MSKSTLNLFSSGIDGAPGRFRTFDLCHVTAALYH